LYHSFQEKITRLDDETDNIAQLRLQRDAAYEQYVKKAKDLRASRITTAHTLDQQVMQQLPVLKLESSEFKTNIQLLDEDRWSANGFDNVRFEARTNKGQAIGAIDKIASGGELARFLLALKVVLSEGEPDKCLIFDEVDSGVGGAVADAVGSRLYALGKTTQTLVITHSPQVAAKGQNHLKISKLSVGDSIISNTTLLDADGHREEVARMLAGEQITDAARMAARTLIDARS
jgi:DNA repair protein RecN (Recombination protein N)